jgi:hypothetical protein
MEHLKGSRTMLLSPFKDIYEESSEDGPFAEVDLESQPNSPGEQHFASGAASLDKDDDIHITEVDQNVSPPVAFDDGRSATTPRPSQQNPERSPMADISPNVPTSAMFLRRRKQPGTTPGAVQGQQLTGSARRHEAQGHHNGQSIGEEVTPRIQNNANNYRVSAPDDTTEKFDYGTSDQSRSTPSLFSKRWVPPSRLFSPQLKMVASAYNSVIKLATQGHSEPHRYTPAEAAREPEPEVYDAPTELHTCCHDAESMEQLSDFLKKCKDGDLGATTEPDNDGCLPLHVISENMGLIRNNFACDPRDFVYDGITHPVRGASSSQGQASNGRKNNSLGSDHISALDAFSPQFQAPAGRRSYGRLNSSNRYPSITNSAPAINIDECDLKSFAWNFIEQLVLHHPMALSTKDNEEYIPFVRSITRWVNFVYGHVTTEDIDSSRQTSSSRSLGTTVSDRNLTGNFEDCVQQQPAAVTLPTPVGEGIDNGDGHNDPQQETNTNTAPTSLGGGNHNGDEHNDSQQETNTNTASISLDNAKNSNPLLKKEDVREKRFNGVRTSPHVEWCLHMLSAIIEHLEKPRESPLTEVKKRQAIVQVIVEAVASVPFFIQTLLLIEDDLTRENIFSLTVVRRVVLNPLSMGKWLTSMLSSDNTKKKVAPGRAVAYLKRLSDITTGEDATDASWAGPSERDQKSIAKRKNDVYQAVGEVDNLIPSMLDLEERMLEQAATTNIVKQVLDDMISRPFAVSVVFFDMLFLAFLLLSFRMAVHGYLIRLNILTWVYVANFCIFYFFIREIGKWVSLSRTMTVARPALSDLMQLLSFQNFWNILDTASIVMTCLSVIFIRIRVAAGDTYDDDINSWRRILFTISTGLLWLRVLGLAKTISMPLATFVLAIVQVRRLEFHFISLLIFFHFAHVMSCLFSLTLY